MSIGLELSGRVHRIEGTGWPTTLHWRIWVESKMATGWAGEMVTEGGTVCLRSEEGEGWKLRGRWERMMSTFSKFLQQSEVSTQKKKN